jgi:hypothetical protein
MSERIELKEIEGPKICSACGYEMRKTDRFCRQCGTRWDKPGGEEVSQVGQDLGSIGASTAPLSKELKAETIAATVQTPLADLQAIPHGSVSGSLVNAFTSGITSRLASTLPAQTGPVLRAMIAALLSIPIWLMIILLSPLDAYLALRTLIK